MAAKSDYEKVLELVANDPHCRSVSEPTETWVTLLSKAALPIVKAALKQ
jgi:hypothetical protein